MAKTGKKKAKRRNQETIIFILMGSIIVGLIISGYFLFANKIIPEFTKGMPSASDKQGKESVSTEELAAADREFIPAEEAQILNIHFALRGSDKLVVEPRRVRKQNMLSEQANQILLTLFEGAHEQKVMYQAMPAGTQVRAVFFESGTFIVDLSKEFLKVNSSGMSEATLAVYSIVNSLTELDPMAKVRFLIDGTEPQARTGYLDLSQVFSRFSTLTKQ